jgi:hypothetical protein
MLQECEPQLQLFQISGWKRCWYVLMCRADGRLDDLIHEDSNLDGFGTQSWSNLHNISLKHIRYLDQLWIDQRPLLLIFLFCLFICFLFLFLLFFLFIFFSFIFFYIISFYFLFCSFFIHLFYLFSLIFHFFHSMFIYFRYELMLTTDHRFQHASQPAAPVGFAASGIQRWWPKWQD